MTNVLSSLYILEISPLSNVGVVKTFSHCRLTFCFVDCIFASQFQEFPLVNFWFQCLCYWVIFRKWSTVPMCSMVLPTFSSVRFSVVGFMLRSLDHLELSFIHGDRYESICLLLHVDIQLCQYQFLKILCFFHFIILASLSKIRCS